MKRLDRIVIVTGIQLFLLFFGGIAFMFQHVSPMIAETLVVILIFCSMLCTKIVLVEALMINSDTDEHTNST